MYATSKEAAIRLRMTHSALCKRLTRGAVRRGKDIICELGDGVVGIKFGRSWRVRFGSPSAQDKA